MPVLTDINIEINGENEIFPNPLPDLFLNEPLIVFGKIKDKVTGVFEKSRENREQRQQTRSNRRKNKSTGGLF